MDTRDILLAIVVAALGVALIYVLDPTFGGLLKKRGPNVSEYFKGEKNTHEEEPYTKGSLKEGFTGVSPDVGGDVAGISNLRPADASFGASQKPDNCYAKDQLKASELLPNDPNSQWAQSNPMAPGSIMDKNFLNAGYQIGVDTVGQSMRNASYDLRSEPPNPQAAIGPWMQSTIEPDTNRRPLEIGA